MWTMIFQWLRPDAPESRANPIFQRKQAELPYGRTPKELSDFNLVILVGLLVVVGLWWLFAETHIPVYFRYEVKYGIPLLVSAGLIGLTSLYVVPAAVLPLHRLLESDLSVLSPLAGRPEQDTRAAYNTLVQIRAWPPTWIEAALRIGTVAMALAEWVHQEVVSGFIVDPFRWATPATLAAFGFFYAIEPILRMRVITALCAAVGVRVRDRSLALFGGLLAVAVFHVAQVLAVALMGSALFMPSSPEAMIVLPGILLCTMTFGGFMLLGLYFWLWEMSNALLESALRRAFPDKEPQGP